MRIEHGAQPWRFRAADYEAAVQMVSGLGHTLADGDRCIVGHSIIEAMQQRRISVAEDAEEALAASLLQDLDDQ